MNAPASQDSAVEAVPDAAAAVFGDRLALAQRYADVLCTDGVLRGLLGPREPGRIWTRHLLNSAALAPHVPLHASVVDLGSGAGLPGIPLALARPDLRMTLLEPMARRMRFLEHVRDELGLGVELVQTRAEQAAPGADVVVARAVAPLARLLELAVPLLRPGGIVLAQKGARAAAELTDAAHVLDRLAPTAVEVHVLTFGDSETSVVRVVTSREPLPLGTSDAKRGGLARGGRPGRGVR